ncbi:MAG: hypothetical protein AB7O66_06715 [Limisphaerales bacterium]
MTLSPRERTGAEPSGRPLLLHNMTAAESAVDGPMGGAVAMLGKRFEMRSLPDSWTADDLKSARLVWLNSTGRPTRGAGGSPDGSGFPQAVLRYVEDGGVLWIMLGDPKRPNTVRSLLMPLGIVQGERRTAPKRLRIPQSNPLAGGMLWITGGLTPMDIEESPGLLNPVMVPNDLSQPPVAPQAADFAGIAMVWGGLGKGRIAVFGDTEWLEKKAWDDPTGSTPGTALRSNGQFLDRWIEWALKPAAPAGAP